MERTLLDYMHNPMGSGSAAMSGRDLIYNDLVKRFISLEGKGSMIPVIYKDAKGNYFFHVMVPSETDRENTYDVIIKFESSKEVENATTLKPYNVKFFSNIPSFTYTYAYVYNKNDLLVDELKDKFDKEVLLKAPVKRNPQETFGYEKSIFFAAYAIVNDDKYLNKLIIDSMTQTYTKKKLENAIRNDEKIKQQIRREQNRIKRAAELKESDIQQKAKKQARAIKSQNMATASKIRSSKSSLSGEQTIRRKSKMKPKGKIKGRK